ncbi:MAG: metalloregulator ArsR/SmtB family transcription factor [Candidatus Omnitrophota bacterium]|nr:metalloregulator ArsR/SmtB family transcription factor [Candidatus Omnitrophota bacterium]
MPRAKLVEKMNKMMDSPEVVDKLSRTFSVLGDPTRTRIIFALSKEELCVAEISMLLGISHSGISHQLRALKDLDLIKCRKSGRKSFYSLNDVHIENLFKEGLKHVLEKI